MAQLRDLPKVDDLARAPGLGRFPESLRVAGARYAVDELRKSIQNGEATDLNLAENLAVRYASSLADGVISPAINMSGVVLHTGLGRARLAPAAIEAMTSVTLGHASIEFDLEEGTRGDRQDHVRTLLCHLTGSEDAMAVNNAAAALVLTLRALAFQRDVLLSRGQMVEIGGSFRVPEIVKESGCRLVEVGTTNKTHLSDYKVGEDTGAILVCHRSNFEIVGFTSEPSVADLAKLGPPVVDDMGTGCLVDLSRFGLRRTKTMADSVREGAAVSIGSGDKLLGGPQAGLIVGRREFLDQIRKSPLARAVRVDKLTLAALRATLSLYATGRELEIPTLKYLARSQDEVLRLAERLASQVPGSVVEPGICEIGGGAGPGTEVPSYRVGVRVKDVAGFAKRMRLSQPAVIGRIENDVFWLDPRTAEESEVDKVGAIARQCLP